MPGKKRTFSTEKTENEKESSVKTEITVSDDMKSDVNNVSDIKPRNSDVRPNRISEVKLTAKNLERINTERFTVNDSVPPELQAHPEVPEVVSGLSSSNCRLFDAYDANPRQSPLPVRPKH